MESSRVRFSQSFGSFATIEGSAGCGPEAIDFELAMTECVSGPVKGVLKKSIPYVEIEDVQVRRRLMFGRRLVFCARSLQTFESMPGAKGYEYEVIPKASGAVLKSFVTDARLAIAQATSERFARQIEESMR